MRYSIRTMVTKTAIAAGTAAVALLMPAAAHAQSSTYQYSFQEHGATESFQDTGFCDPGPADITLSNYNEDLHVSATVPGLTQDQLEALLDQNSDQITKATYTQTGSFTVVEASGVTYTGHFTDWHGGSINGHTDVFSGTFSVQGVGSDGSRVSGEFPSHITLINGVPVIDFDKGHINGCLTTT